MFSLSSKYSFEDLNRVEGKIEELKESINSVFGYTPDYPMEDYPIEDYPKKTIDLKDLKLDWDEKDFPYLDEIDRIKQNIIKLTEYFIIPYNFQELEFGKRFFDFKEANKLEFDLNAVEKALDQALIKFSGESYSGDTIWL